MLRKIIFIILVIILGLWFYSNLNTPKNLNDYPNYEEKIDQGIEEVNRLTLYKKTNEDIIGQLTINQVINETIVQGKDNSEYVRKNIYGQYSQKGVPFLDYRVNDTSQNNIIYGHSSKKSPIIFTNLMNYLDYDFLCNNPFIHFNHHDNDEKYQIISVYTINVNEYYDPIIFETNFENNIFFQKMVANILEYSIHPTTYDYTQALKLITLVTCNTKNSDERLLVIGSLVS